MFFRRKKIGGTVKEPVSIITDKAIKNYKHLCNFGKDSDDVAKIKITRDVMLGRIVSFNPNDYERYIVQYYDVLFSVEHTIVTKVFKSKRYANFLNNKFGEFKVENIKYNKFNKKYGLSGRKYD